MLDEELPVAFLAPYGGGKTSACRYIQFRWKQEKPHTFITVYDNFTSVAEQLPNVTVNSHRSALIASFSLSFWQYIQDTPDTLLDLSEKMQLWWWCLLQRYLPGLLLDFRIDNVPELVSSYKNYKESVLMGYKNQPFHPREQLPIILQIIRDQLRSIGFSRWLILIDKVDSGTLSTQVDLNCLLTPLFNTTSLFCENITWKYFLPEMARSSIELSLARWRAGLKIVQSFWGETELTQFFQNRLLWASEGKFDSLDSWSEQLQVDRELIRLVSNNLCDLGGPHQILFLGDLLTSDLKPNSRITRAVWHSFLQGLTDVYFVKDPFGLTRLSVEKPSEQNCQEKIRNIPKPELRIFIDNHFNESELVTLAYDLQIKEEDLKGNTHKQKVISLIEHCKRHNIFDNLIKAVCKERPFILNRFSD